MAAARDLVMNTAPAELVGQLAVLLKRVPVYHYAAEARESRRLNAFMSDAWDRARLTNDQGITQ